MHRLSGKGEGLSIPSLVLQWRYPGDVPVRGGLPEKSMKSEERAKDWILREIYLRDSQKKHTDGITKRSIQRGVGRQQESVVSQKSGEEACGWQSWTLQRGQGRCGGRGVPKEHEGMRTKTLSGNASWPHRPPEQGPGSVRASASFEELCAARCWAECLWWFLCHGLLFGYLVWALKNCFDL